MKLERHVTLIEDTIYSLCQWMDKHVKDKPMVDEKVLSTIPEVQAVQKLLDRSNEYEATYPCYVLNWLAYFNQTVLLSYFIKEVTMISRTYHNPIEIARATT